MKKIILLTISVLILVIDCFLCILLLNQRKKVMQERIEWHNPTVIIDSCEYIYEKTERFVEHKGNCRFCAERRKQELKELVEQLKEK